MRLPPASCLLAATALILAPVAASATTGGTPAPSATHPSSRLDAPAPPNAGRQALPGVGWADVYIPSGLEAGKRAPLALLLHGSGDRGSTMISAFADLADRHAVILLAVDSRDYSWDTMVKGSRLRNTTSVPVLGDDVDRIEDALARAFELYPVDPERVALIGFSDGAGYGLSLGANNAGLFRSVIAFAPGLLTRIDGEDRGRVFLAHGENDRVLPAAATRDIFAPALRGLGFEVELALFKGRHEMPPELRARAFDWWLGQGSANAG